MNSIGVLALIIGFILTLAGFYVLKIQDTKTNTADTVRSILLGELFFSGIGMIVIGIAALMFGIDNRFSN